MVAVVGLVVPNLTQQDYWQSLGPSYALQLYCFLWLTAAKPLEFFVAKFSILLKFWTYTLFCLDFAAVIVS